MSPDEPVIFVVSRNFGHDDDGEMSTSTTSHNPRMETLLALGMIMGHRGSRGGLGTLDGER